MRVQRAIGVTGEQPLFHAFEQNRGCNVVGIRVQQEYSRDGLFGSRKPRRVRAFRQEEPNERFGD